MSSREGLIRVRETRLALKAVEVNSFAPRNYCFWQSTAIVWGCIFSVLMKMQAFALNQTNALDFYRFAATNSNSF